MNNLEELKQKLADKKAELKAMQDGHMEAWEDYGSELCVGDMLNREANLELEILDIEYEIECCNNKQE